MSEPEPILSWIDRELAEADLMSDEGSYDGEDYWLGVHNALTTLRNKITSGEIRVI